MSITERNGPGALQQRWRGDENRQTTETPTSLLVSEVQTILSEDEHDEDLCIVVRESWRRSRDDAMEAEMSKHPTSPMKAFGITPHQSRILLVLRALEETHGQRWWSRNAIGHVLNDYYRAVNVASMAALKKRTLVCTERSTWTEELDKSVRCRCAWHEWGLTAMGRTIAIAQPVKWSKELLERIHTPYPSGNEHFRCDEDDAVRQCRERWAELDRDDDDDL